MYKKILVPLDGTQLAELALPYAKELSGRLNLDMTILHVCSPEEQVFTSMHQSYIDQIAKRIANQAMEIQLNTSSPDEFKPIEAKGELVVGYPAEEILDYAKNHKIDFIIVATHGYSGLKRWRLGSVADKVLRASRVPILLVRTKTSDEVAYDKWPSKTLIVPLDGSGIAESVLPHVEILAKQRGIGPINVVLISIVEQPTISSDYPEASMPISWEEHVEQTIAWLKLGSKQYLEKIANRLTDSFGFKVKIRVLMGNPAKEIIKYSNRHPFSLIVMATHGHSGIFRWTYGSVADRVLRGSSSPVFLVRPPRSK